MSSDSEPDSLLGVPTPRLCGFACERCEDTGWVWDDSACGDPDHCSSVYPCGDCNPEGES